MSNDYPPSLNSVDQMVPSPRRVRATLGGRVVVDTTRAVYVWEHPAFPQYYIPVDDIDPSVVSLAKVRADGLARFESGALDSWFEEDEEIFGHPRSPYHRVDALRSSRHVRVELDGVTLAESSSPVLLFETALPTRYYISRTDLNMDALEHTGTQTLCPYKGRTSDYWTVRTPAGVYPDFAWSYAFPLPAVAAIAGLVAFYNEKVDLYVDGRAQERPVTPFS
ncbi:DUF427 domain-containing protein [Actinoplanes sp. CA-142083]|uniref:DUF427 domain-containing protein n=1 Tax=Actinoplanes sp. CA-142083 TaxID=3239903 RepID=UPI003D91CDB9